MAPAGTGSDAAVDSLKGSWDNITDEELKATLLAELTGKKPEVPAPKPAPRPVPAPRPTKTKVEQEALDALNALLCSFGEGGAATLKRGHTCSQEVVHHGVKRV